MLVVALDLYTFRLIGRHFFSTTENEDHKILQCSPNGFSANSHIFVGWRIFPSSIFITMFISFMARVFLTLNFFHFTSQKFIIFFFAETERNHLFSKCHKPHAWAWPAFIYHLLIFWTIYFVNLFEDKNIYRTSGINPNILSSRKKIQFIQLLWTIKNVRNNWLIQFEFHNIFSVRH